ARAVQPAGGDLPDPRTVGAGRGVAPDQTEGQRGGARDRRAVDGGTRRETPTALRDAQSDRSGPSRDLVEAELPGPYALDFQPVAHRAAGGRRLQREGDGPRWSRPAPPANHRELEGAERPAAWTDRRVLRQGVTQLSRSHDLHMRHRRRGAPVQWLLDAHTHLDGAHAVRHPVGVAGGIAIHASETPGL